MFKSMEEQGIFFIETELNYNLNLSLMMPNNYRDNQRRSLKLPEIPTTDQPDKDQLRAWISIKALCAYPESLYKE